MTDLAVYDMDRTVTRRATYTPFLLHCALHRAPWRLTFLPLVILSMLAYVARLIDRGELKEINHRLLLGHRVPLSELKPLVDDVYETALILGEGAGVAVNLQFTADVTIMADRTRLRQLFLNLVTNAIKYTPAGGKVDIGLGVHPDNVTFAVRDTGIGIAAADVPYIFERFWRADRARSRMSERGGFGLGLAISQWIAQAHGGTLTASSRLGRGSLFTVTLPLMQAATT